MQHHLQNILGFNSQISHSLTFPGYTQLVDLDFLIHLYLSIYKTHILTHYAELPSTTI